MHKQQAGSGLLRRFRAAVHQCKHLAELQKAANTTMPLYQSVDFDRLQLRRIRQCIEPNYSARPTSTPSQIERSSRGCCDRYAVDRAYLVLPYFVAMNEDAGRRLSVTAVQLRG